jgi:putative ABC transport system permease protein
LLVPYISATVEPGAAIAFPPIAAKPRSSRETSALVGSTAEYAQATVVSPEFFRVFAVEPVVGRLFTAEEVKQGSGGAVMISHAYWQSHFGGDPRVLGQTVRMYGRALPISGVLPPGFNFPGKTDLWFPTTRPPEFRAAHNYLAVGRLKPGVGVQRAQAEMASIAGRLEQQYPDSNKGQSVAVARMRDDSTASDSWSIHKRRCGAPLTK